jgi:hypothetical protein
MNDLLEALPDCLARFLLSIAMIHSSLNSIGHQKRFGRCCLYQNRRIAAKVLRAGTRG